MKAPRSAGDLCTAPPGAGARPSVQPASASAAAATAQPHLQFEEPNLRLGLAPEDPCPSIRQYISLPLPLPTLFGPLMVVPSPCFRSALIVASGSLTFRPGRSRPVRGRAIRARGPVDAAPCDDRRRCPGPAQLIEVPAIASPPPVPFAPH